MVEPSSLQLQLLQDSVPLVHRSWQIKKGRPHKFAQVLFETLQQPHAVGHQTRDASKSAIRRWTPLCPASRSFIRLAP